MGLDSYLYILPYRPSPDPDLLQGGEEIAYWRKNRDLNSEMFQLARKRGEGAGDGYVFVILTAEDLEEIKGYFDQSNTLEKARKALREGKFLYYQSFW